MTLSDAPLLPLGYTGSMMTAGNGRRKTRESMTAIRVSDLTRMSPEDRVTAVADLARAARRAPNGEVSEIEAGIEAYEAKYGIDSDELQRQVAEGRRAETEDVCGWLMLLRLREHLATVAARPR